MVRSTPDTRVVRIAVGASLVQTALPALDRRIDEAIVARATRVALDLSELGAVDSAGLTWLLTAQDRLGAEQIGLVFDQPTELFRDVLVATRLEARLSSADAAGGDHA